VSASAYAYLGFLALLAGERVFELALSRRNAERAFARGGVERGQRHFRAMALLHTTFFPACALEALASGRGFDPRIGIPMLLFALGAQALRYAAIAALGDAWNVRVIVVPGEPAQRRGVYRYLRHPNYLAVAIELVAVPLIHGAWLTALAFTLANAWLLRVRIRCEEAALREFCDYDERMGSLARFVPRRAPSELT
jgi:methyltransferase